jgi:hypothetical protein
VWRCGGYVTGGAVCTGCAGRTGEADDEPPSVTAGEVAGGAVATGVFTDEVLLLPDDEDARSAKKSENAATSATPAPASQRVVDEIRRMPLSRSAGRCGATRPRSIVRRRPEEQPAHRRYEPRVNAGQEPRENSRGGGAARRAVVVSERRSDDGLSRRALRLAVTDGPPRTRKPTGGVQAEKALRAVTRGCRDRGI